MNEYRIDDDVFFHHQSNNHWTYSQDFEYSSQFIELADVVHPPNVINSLPSTNIYDLQLTQKSSTNAKLQMTEI